MSTALILMIAGVIGAIIGVLKDKQGYPWGRPLTIVCVILTLLLAAVTMLPDRSQQRVASQYMEQEQRYQEIAGQKIGRMLAEKYPDGHALVLAPSRDVGHHQVGLEREIRNRLSMEVVAFDYRAAYRNMMEEQGIPAEEFDESMAYMGPEDVSMMMNAQLMDELIRQAGQTPDVIVNLLGLPYDYENMRFWRTRNHPPMVIASTMGYMGMGDLADRIARGHISALVIRNPEAGFDLDNIPRDIDEAFNKRYILVTPDNVDEISSQYPDLFSGF